MVLTARKGEVIRLHPRLVEKWANRYIRIYKAEGPVPAKKWASEFLDDEQRTVMSEKIKEILKKRRPR